MGDKTNWSRLQKRSPDETVKNRNVYEAQQLERSSMGNKQNPWVNRILMATLSVVLTVVFYFVLSAGQFGMSMFQSYTGTKTADNQTRVETMFKENIKTIHRDNEDGERVAYFIIDENGDKKPDDGKGYLDKTEVYQTYKNLLISRNDLTEAEVKEADAIIAGLSKQTFWYALRPAWWKVIASLVFLLIVGAALIAKGNKLTASINAAEDTADINQHPNDQHIALPEEIQRKFDWFPDVGAHSDVQFSSMISHMALTNKGLKSIKVAKRAKNDIVNEDGDIEFYKGEVLVDDDGNPIYETKPMIDTAFMDALFEASGNPSDKSSKNNINKKYDATKIPYNPDGKDRDKLGKFNTVADLINADWDFPYYEPQRPGGAYIVDTAPVNTMVLAITRAGKGQTVIE